MHIVTSRAASPRMSLGLCIVDLCMHMCCCVAVLCLLLFHVVWSSSVALPSMSFHPIPHCISAVLVSPRAHCPCCHSCCPCHPDCCMCFSAGAPCMHNGTELQHVRVHDSHLQHVMLMLMPTHVLPRPPPPLMLPLPLPLPLQSLLLLLSHPQHHITYASHQSQGDECNLHIHRISISRTGGGGG